MRLPPLPPPPPSHPFLLYHGGGAELFWRRAPEVLPAPEMENVLRRVEKGERKLGEIERLTKATRKFLSLWRDPLAELSFKYSGSHGHVFGADEDRHLLFYTNRHG